jgi:hypothetical protein
MLSVEEMAVLQSLKLAYQKFLTCEADHSVECASESERSEEWAAACEQMLRLLDRAVQIFGVSVASRSFRQTFTANYRALFAHQGELYHVDVFEACLDPHEPISVNGEDYTLEEATIVKGTTLKRIFDVSLSHCVDAAAQTRTKTDLQLQLSSLDTAWADFEKAYITDLIGIEKRSRGVLAEAVSCEHALAMAERADDGSACAAVLVAETRSRLAECIARLNAVANSEGRGRSDLSVDVLEQSLRVLDANAALAVQGDAAARACHGLAGNVVGAFEALRRYLRKMGACMDRADPHLRLNQDLAQRLMDWEESWEMGAKYVMNSDVLRSVCQIAAFVAAQRSMPAFRTMCEDCDSEFFMVLPRLVWLAFLNSPEEHAELLHSLLPKAFATNAKTLVPELAEFVSRFRKTQQLLRTKEGLSTRAGGDIVHGAFVESAVQGPRRAMADGGCSAATAVEAFLMDLEKWNLELQRACPADWNHFAAMIARLTNSNDETEMIDL